MEDRIVIVSESELNKVLKENEKLNKENEELRQSLEKKAVKLSPPIEYNLQVKLYEDEKVKVVKASMEIDKLRKLNNSLEKQVDNLLDSDRRLKINNHGLVKEVDRLVKVLQKEQSMSVKMERELKDSNSKIDYFKNVVKNNMENLEQMDQKLVNLVCKVKLLFDTWESGALTKSSDIYTTTKELVLKLYNENTADELSVEKVIEPEKPKFIAGNELIPGISILSVIQQNKRTILNVRESKYGMSKTINATNYHMCEDCKSCFPECDGKEIAFGDSPNGSDNIIACNGYKPYEKGEKHEK